MQKLGVARLPNELFRPVVAGVYDPDPAQERATLHSLLFVSRVFYRSTLPVLYKSLKAVRGKKQIPALNRTLTSNAGLALSVHKAEIEFDLLIDYGEFDPPNLPNCSILKLQAAQDLDNAFLIARHSRLPRIAKWISACSNLKLLVLSPALVLDIFGAHNVNTSVVELQDAWNRNSEVAATIVSLENGDIFKIYVTSEPIPTHKIGSESSEAVTWLFLRFHAQEHDIGPEY